jgi:tRNA threonylcarbamoyladenosine biosynthesis protein TsaE
MSSSIKKIKFKKEEIPEISQKILAKISKNKKIKILAFDGTLGVGKTTITKEIAKILGIKNKVISPTFVIMKSYDIDKKLKIRERFKKLIHIDAYRLEKPDDILKIGWKEVMEDKNNLIIIEWPENIKKHIKEDYIWVKLKHIDEETRLLEFY